MKSRETLSQQIEKVVRWLYMRPDFENLPPRPTAREIYDTAILVAEELGSSYSGKTTELVYEDQGLRIIYRSILGAVDIEYDKNGYRPVFSYKLVQGAIRYNYGSWVDKLYAIKQKADMRVKELEDEFFGDLVE